MIKSRVDACISKMSVGCSADDGRWVVNGNVNILSRFECGEVVNCANNPINERSRSNTQQNKSVVYKEIIEDERLSLKTKSDSCLCACKLPTHAWRF